MSESAIDWIKRHKQGYEIVSSSPFNVREVFFTKSLTSPNWVILKNDDGDSVATPVETADDCEALCRLLRITPEPLS